MKEVTKEFISKTSLNAYFCHAGLSGIFLHDSEQVGRIPDKRE